MSRSRHKEWRNGKPSNWNCRIIWLGSENGEEDIRFKMMDNEREFSIYPRTLDEANQIWEAFKESCPTCKEGEQIYFVRRFIHTLDNEDGKWSITERTHDFVKKSPQE